MRIRLISPKRAKKALTSHDGWIRIVANRYGVPAEAVKAILFQEMTMIDPLDVAADLAVWTNLFRKKDSSTGYA